MMGGRGGGSLDAVTVMRSGGTSASAGGCGRCYCGQAHGDVVCRPWRAGKAGGAGRAASRKGRGGAPCSDAPGGAGDRGACRCATLYWPAHAGKLGPGAGLCADLAPRRPALPKDAWSASCSRVVLFS